MASLEKAWGPTVHTASNVAVTRNTKIPDLLFGWMESLQGMCLESASYEYKIPGDTASVTDVRTTGIMIVFEVTMDNQDVGTDSEIAVRLYPQQMVLTVGDHSASYLVVKGDMWKQMTTGMIASKIVGVFEKHLGWNMRPY